MKNKNLSLESKYTSLRLRKNSFLCQENCLYLFSNTLK